MIITEQDLFNYIFFRELLPGEKIKYIENSGLFSGILSLYKHLRISLKDENNPEVSKGIFILKPVAVPEKKRAGSRPRLAAASADLTRKTEFTTYTDEQSNYLVRLLKTGEKNLLYIISSDERTDKKLKLTVYPSEKSYLVENTNSPVELQSAAPVDLIHLEEI